MPLKIRLLGFITIMENLCGVTRAMSRSIRKMLASCTVTFLDEVVFFVIFTQSSVPQGPPEADEAGLPS